MPAHERPRVDEQPLVDELPLVDEHSTDVAAGVDDLWAALVDIDRSFAGPGTGVYARAVGCVDHRSSGPRPLAVGSTMPGFRVVAAEPPSRLVLAGRHRFSSYALAFHIEEIGPGRSRLRAESRATFPGAGGAAYRALVIGTGGHVVAVRRLLSGRRRAAEHRALG